MPNKEIQQEIPQERFVREPERARITGIPTSSWYTMQQQGLAPRPYHIGPRTVAWKLSSLLAWIEQQTVNGGTWQSIGQAASRVVNKAGKATGP